MPSVVISGFKTTEQAYEYGKSLISGDVKLIQDNWTPRIDDEKYAKQAPRTDVRLKFIGE